MSPDTHWTIGGRRFQQKAACVEPCVIGVGAPGLKVNPNLFASTRDILRELKNDDRQWVGAAAVSWFWLIGAVTLSIVPVVVKSRIGAGSLEGLEESIIDIDRPTANRGALKFFRRPAKPINAGRILRVA